MDLDQELDVINELDQSSLVESNRTSSVSINCYQHDNGNLSVQQKDYSSSSTNKECINNDGKYNIVINKWSLPSIIDNRSKMYTI